MRRSICVTVATVLALAVAPGTNASGRTTSAPSADYVNALRVANLFLGAWVERAPETGMRLMSARLLTAEPDGSRPDLRDGLQQYMSGLSNPHHEAFEIGAGRSAEPDRIVFPVRLFEHYLGESTGYVYSDSLVAMRQGDEWRVDRLPRTYGPAIGETFSPEKFGIGVFFSQADSTSPVTVLQCTPNGPGEKAGLLPGDLLVALDTLSAEGWPLSRALSYLSRHEPTPVALTVLRGSEQLTMRMVRMRFADIAAGADLKLSLNNDSTGYIAVPLHEVRAVKTGDLVPVAIVESSECREVRLQLGGGGRLTFVYFWASWCGPCKRFMLTLKQAIDAGSALSHVRVIGVNLDEDCARFQEWTTRLEPPGEQYAGGGWRGELAQRFRIYRRGIPSGALLAEDGSLIRVTTGTDSLMALLKASAAPK